MFRRGARGATRNCASPELAARAPRWPLLQSTKEVVAGLFAPRRLSAWPVSPWLLMLAALLVTSLASPAVHATSSEKERCEDITIPMCKGIGYNYTSMPNQFHHDAQDEAGLEVHQFWPLVEIQCSDDLRFFLCSMYTPICIEDYQGRLPACRSVCERARAGCAPIMRQYGFAWPERMSCEELPEYGDQERLCMDAKEGAQPEQPENGGGGKNSHTASKDGRDRPGRPSYKGSRPYRGRDRHDRLVPANLPSPGSGKPVVDVGGPGQELECKCDCRYPMVSLVDRMDVRYFNAVETGTVSNCAIPCRGVFFTQEEKNFSNYWIGMWAIMCCASTSVTVLTFLIDMQRFRYPERPIIFLSGCYLMVSIGYLVRIFMGHEAVACDGPIIRYHASGRPAACTIVFLLVYFFGMASSLWWVILALTWLLAAGLKWGNEAIAGYSQYFHLAAWLVPTVKSIAVLAIGAVDGDPIAGVCSVGNQDMNHLRAFVLAPLCVYLLLGTSFLLAGFVALFRIRNVIRQQARAKVDKLEKLMIRIGVFSVLYTVPATIVIGCHFYEQFFKETWERRHNCPCAVPNMRPDFSVYMLKYFMCLVVGITSGFWIWSGKTLESWGNFYARICGTNVSNGGSHMGGGAGVPGGQAVAHARTFKQLSPASHVGHVPPHCKQLPLSHV